MKPDSQLAKTLKQAGATLLREKNHYVWQLPSGQRFVFAKTASDSRSAKNALSHLRRLIAAEATFRPETAPIKQLPPAPPLFYPAPTTPTAPVAPLSGATPLPPPPKRRVYSLPPAVITQANQAFRAGGEKAYNAYLKEIRMNPHATPPRTDLGELTLRTQKAIADQRQQLSLLERELKGKQAEIENKNNDLKLLSDFLEALTLTLEAAKHVQGLLTLNLQPELKPISQRARTRRGDTAERVLALIHEGRRVSALRSALLEEMPTLTMAALYGIISREKNRAKPRFALVDGWVKKL